MECWKCGYDLTALPMGRGGVMCPECGFSHPVDFESRQVPPRLVWNAIATGILPLAIRQLEVELPAPLRGATAHWRSFRGCRCAATHGFAVRMWQ